MYWIVQVYNDSTVPIQCEAISNIWNIGNNICWYKDEATNNHLLWRQVQYTILVCVNIVLFILILQHDPSVQDERNIWHGTCRVTLH